MKEYDKLKKDDLIVALNERDNQITELLAGGENNPAQDKEISELNDLLAEAMGRLSEAEKGNKKGILLTRVGAYTVRGHGMSYEGVAYTIAELKNKPEVVKAIFDTGSELVTKNK